jgi:aspartate ammonia-lyase
MSPVSGKGGAVSGRRLRLDIENPADREFFAALAVFPGAAGHDGSTNDDGGGDAYALPLAVSIDGKECVLEGVGGFGTPVPLVSLPQPLPGIADERNCLFDRDGLRVFLFRVTPSAAFPPPLVLGVELADMPAAVACLAVAAPYDLSDMRGRCARVAAGSVAFSDLAGPGMAGLGRAAQVQAFRLAFASQAVGLRPAGSALLLSCRREDRTRMLEKVFGLLARLGCGPFIAASGIDPDALDDLLSKVAPLCRMPAGAFGPVSIAAIEEKAGRLYGASAEAIFPTHGEFLRLVSIALGLDAGLRFAAGEQALAPEERLPQLGDTLRRARRWSQCYGFSEERLGEALLQARFMQACDTTAWRSMRREVATNLAAWADERPAPIAPGLYALGLPCSGMRIEHDSLGQVAVPAHVYYGAQTERSRRNFAVEGIPIGRNRKFIAAMGLVKECAARANARIGLLDPRKADAIAEAAREVGEGIWDRAFPVDRLQGGGGVGMNMNVNEVVANRASELLGGTPGSGLVHPNDDVNLCHSTNDLVHTAMHLAFWDWMRECDASLGRLESTLRGIADRHAHTVKLGRTCLMDALPMTLGQQFSGYAAFVARRRKALADLGTHCRELPMGGTGVGTGLGIAPGFLPAFFELLAEKKGASFRPASNYFDSLQHADFYVDLSAQLKACVTGLSSLARDLRLMNSGPRAGFGEIVLPAAQPGSSIMPGKINPLIPEQINQIAYLICGNDGAVAMAAEGGDIDLNVWEAVFLQCITQSFQLLCNGTDIFTASCLDGLSVNEKACLAHAESSLALATVISEAFGYERGVEIATLAAREGLTIKEAALRAGLVGEADADVLLDPALLTDREKYIQVLAAYRKKRGTAAK